MSDLGHVWTAPWQELSDVAATLVGCGHVSGLLMRRMNARANPELMARRRCAVEHPFATIKRMTAGGRFLSRNLKGTLAYNMLRAINIRAVAA